VPPGGVDRDDERLERIAHASAQFVEMAIPTLAAIFLRDQRARRPRLACLVPHEATTIWDVSYAYRTRVVTPTEQHVHGFLERLPLMGLLIVATLHWQQFLALFGLVEGWRLRPAAEGAAPPGPWLLPYLQAGLRSKPAVLSVTEGPKLPGDGTQQPRPALVGVTREGVRDAWNRSGSKSSTTPAVCSSS
jgi:hypothetical protein